MAVPIPPPPAAAPVQPVVAKPIVPPPVRPLNAQNASRSSSSTAVGRPLASMGKTKGKGHPGLHPPQVRIRTGLSVMEIILTTFITILYFFLVFRVKRCSVLRFLIRVVGRVVKVQNLSEEPRRLIPIPEMIVLQGLGSWR